MIIACLLFASVIDGTLFAAVALLGMCYGVQFFVMIPTVFELFSLKHFGTFYNFLSLRNPLGAFLFSGLLAGYIYLIIRWQSSMELICWILMYFFLGPNCFKITFLILAGVCSVGSILGIILSVRIRLVYQMLYSRGSFKFP